MGHRPGEPPPAPPARGWRRYLGPPNSWRRIALTGVAGGIALAIIASVVGTAIGGGGVNFGSVDKKQSTPVPVVDTTSDIPNDVPIEPPAEIPVDEVPTDVPVEVPTDTPVVEEPIDTPVEELPTDTPVLEIPTDVLPDELLPGAAP